MTSKTPKIDSFVIYNSTFLDKDWWKGHTPLVKEEFWVVGTNFTGKMNYLPWPPGANPEDFPTLQWYEHYCSKTFENERIGFPMGRCHEPHICKHNKRVLSVSFEHVFNSSPEEAREGMLFYLDKLVEYSNRVTGGVVF